MLPRRGRDPEWTGRAKQPPWAIGPPRRPAAALAAINARECPEFRRRDELCKLIADSSASSPALAQLAQQLAEAARVLVREPGPDVALDRGHIRLPHALLQGAALGRDRDELAAPVHVSDLPHHHSPPSH